MKTVMPEKITAQVGDKHVSIETGKLAKQADGAVTVQLGETIVIVAAVAATKAKEGQEFFPLTWAVIFSDIGFGPVGHRETSVSSDGVGTH